MFDFEKISASRFYVAPTAERVVEFSPPGIDMDNVSRVLSLAVEAKCTELQPADGYAQVNGRTSFSLVYLDKAGAAKGVDYNADFAVKVEGDFSADDSAYAELYVMESDVEASDGLRLSAVIEVKVSAVKRQELNVLKSADDCYISNTCINLPSFIASKSISVPFDGEAEVGGEISNVLGVHPTVFVQEAKATDGGAIVKATVNATVTYVENSEIKQKDFKLDLEEEVGLDGVEKTDNILVHAAIKSSKVVLQGVTDDNTIKVEGEVSFRLQAFRTSKVEVVSDVLSISNELEVTRTKFESEAYDGSGFFKEDVFGSAMLGDNRAGALEIAALPYARCYPSKAQASGNTLTVEGVVNTDVIYLDENGYNSVRTEIPFSVSFESETVFSKDVSVKCSVMDIAAKIKKEREFEIEMTLAVMAHGYSELDGSYISQVTVGEEKPQNTSAISLYISKEGDELLDLCKAFTAMPDDILRQNPDLNFPLQAGERVVFFRGIPVAV